MGNLYLCGYVNRPVTYFDSTRFLSNGLPTTPTLTAPNGFIVKIDSMGNVVRVSRITGPGPILVRGMEVSPAGEVVIAGSYLSVSATFDHLFIFGNQIANRGFLAKYDQNGVPEMAVSTGWSTVGHRPLFGKENKGAYLIGTYTGDWAFKGDTVRVVGRTDLFLAGFDQHGNPLWNKPIHSVNQEAITGAVRGTDHSLYLTIYSSPATQGPPLNMDEVLVSGASDSFIGKIGDATTPLFPSVAPMAGLKVFPNPVADKINIEFNYPPPGPLPYRLLNVQGKALDSGHLSGPEYQLDLSPYPPGIYFLQIGPDNALTTQKVIKIPQ